MGSSIGPPLQPHRQEAPSHRIVPNARLSDLRVTGVTRRRGLAVLLAALLVLIGLFHALTLRPGHDWGDDFAQYIHHAKNIALGIDYNQTGYIWNPSFPMLGPQTYPPV